MRVLDLFSGIGGFSLGLERTGGFETVAFCEIEDYPRKVLAKHWPGVPIYGDVRTLTAERLAADGITGIDVITGGFPCQDLSVAGKQAGMGEGTRSGLWSEIARLIGELRPRYAIVENVTALLSGDRGRWFGRVLGDLAALGYDAEWHCIPASELGAHHHRDRVWIIAYAKELQRDGSNNDAILIMGDEQVPKSGDCYWSPDMAYAVQFRSGKNIFKCEQPNSAGPSSRSIDSRTHTSDVADPISERQQGQGEYVKPLLAEAIGYWKAVNAESGCISGIWAVEPLLGRVANGIPHRAHRLKGLGNAIVPQIAELIGRAIMEVETKKASEDA